MTSASEWRKYMSPTDGRLSVGPRILFALSSDKDEDTETKIRQLRRDGARSLSLTSNWTIAKRLWLEAEKLLLGDGSQKEFQEYLSTGQYHSFTMLGEWLQSDWEFEPVVRELHDSIYCNEDASLIHEGQDLETSHVGDEVFRQRTLYQKLMADLLRVESSPAHWIAERGPEVYGDFMFDYLDKCRGSAWQLRTAQRISWNFTSVSWFDGLNKCSTFQVFENPLPRMDYCPWLKKDLSPSGFPRFLWHIPSNRTLDTLELPQKVQYTCISHTWGRWRDKQWARIQGVPWEVPLNSRFNVVELPDTFSKIRGRFTTEYIWIDLFCIPQQADDPMLASITTQEIARQAAIFQNASACIAWLNYVDDWVGEYCTVGWLSGKHAVLSRQPGMGIAGSVIQAAEQGCNVQLQLTKLSAPTSGLPMWRQKLVKGHESLSLWWHGLRNLPSAYDCEPSDWFSGVWTLQEAYLRPNMVLADKHWNVLCDPAGEPTSLEELFTLNDVVWSLGEFGTQVIGRFLIRGHGIEDLPINDVVQIHMIADFRKDCPPGPLQLNEMIVKTCMSPKGVGSRVEPLVQANKRICTAGRHGRAQAIMSSMGVAEWFESKPQVEDKDLVLDMYPRAFLHEAASKIGPDFYLLLKRSPSPWATLNPFARFSGTMLPFEKARDSSYRGGLVTRRRMPVYSNSDDLHPSVSSWQIQRNGSIEIARAAILASTREQGPLSHTAVLLKIWGSRQREYQRVILSDWIATQPKALDTFAVYLTRGGWYNAGVILQGWHKHIHNTRRTTKLVKVGNFDVIQDSLAVPISQPVDWTVL
ncbi:MAG: hypothetical protein L6R39_005400 [Caloplaca ligustica]|nr:MAG: hypothetical protein L6R39_005400 [Caloplaca ligustica]